MGRSGILIPVLLLLTTGLARGAPPDAAALGKALADPNLDAAYQASEQLRKLGSAAAPALDSLVAALERTLPESVQKMHWDPWMAVLPSFHENLIRTIDAISPKDPGPIVPLSRHLARSPVEIRSLVVRMYLRLWPETAAVRESLLGIAKGGYPSLDEEARTLLRGWVDSRDETTRLETYAALLRHGSVDDRRLAVRRLGAMGAPGESALEKAFADDVERAFLVETWARSGRLPALTLPTAAEWLTSDWWTGDRPALARALDASTTDRADLVARLEKGLEGQHFHFPGWRTVCADLPVVSRQVGTAWFAKHRPAASDAAFDEAGRRRTALVGGKGGSPFETISEKGTLVGLHYTLGDVSWYRVVRSMEPLFETPVGVAVGARAGHEGPKKGTIRAEDGYAVGGLYVQGGERVIGFAVLFLRKKGDALDPSDAYVHAWHGGAIVGQREVLVGGHGNRIVGLVGRSGADLDAIGLVEAKGAANEAAK